MAIKLLTVPGFLILLIWENLNLGDTTYDMAMAVSAGTAAVGVAWGYHPVGALFGAGASIVVERAADLGALFAGSPVPNAPRDRTPETLSDPG